MNFNKYLEESLKYEKSSLLQSVQFNLTPSTKNLRQNSVLSESLFSISNYLQRESSQVYTNELKNNFQFKYKGLNLIQQKQNFEIQDFHENNQSLLLLDSEIKLNDNNQNFIIDSSIGNKVILQRQNMDKDNTVLTKSSQLLRLLSLSSNNSINCQSGFEIQKLKEIYSNLLISNEQLLKKVNTIQQRQFIAHPAIFQEKCLKCSQLQFEILDLKTLLQQKSLQIAKYENKIQKVNEELFDLKVDKKNLEVQNKHLLTQFQKILSEKYQKSIFPVVSCDDVSLNPQINSYYEQTPISTYKSFQNSTKKSKSPQTPVQSSKVLKGLDNMILDSRKSKEKIDHHFQKRISQVKEPLVKDLDRLGVDRSSEKSKSPQKYIEKNMKFGHCRHKSQKQIPRFSNFSKSSGLQVPHIHEKSFLKPKESFFPNSPMNSHARQQISNCSPKKQYGKFNHDFQGQNYSDLFNISNIPKQTDEYYSKHLTPKHKPSIGVLQKQFKSFQQIGKMRYQNSKAFPSQGSHTIDLTEDYSKIRCSPTSGLKIDQQSRENDPFQPKRQQKKIFR